MRPIDADELKKLREDVIAGRLNVGSEGDLVDLCPTIDAVPVVRCKDCRNRHSSEFCECRPEDAFCSDGERKDGDSDV